MNQELYTILKAIHKNKDTTHNMCYVFYGYQLKRGHPNQPLCDGCICSNCPFSSYNLLMRPKDYITPLLLGFDSNVG